MRAIAAVEPTLGRQVWNFARHFLEMCVAMCAGGALLALVVFGGMAALIGSPNLREQFPEPSLLGIAFVLALPMAAWMRSRGMGWRPIGEMSIVPIAIAIAWIAAAGTDLVPSDALQVEFGQFCGISCVGMFVAMLFRLDLYTGRTGHHSARATPAAHEAAP